MPAAWDYSQLPATTLVNAVPFRLSATGSPDGGPCFQAGAIPHNGTSQARLFAPSAGVFTVGYRVSSEGGYDFLTAKAQFSANNLFRVSGAVGWATATVHMAAGEALDVTYTKDGSAVSGSDTGWITLAFASDTFAIQGRAALSLMMQGVLRGATTARMLQGRARLRLTVIGLLNPRKAIKAKVALRLLARHGTAQPPSGLGMQMTILADPYRPAVIRDQYLRVWFNGHPHHCRIALKLDEGVEFEPVFTWQNPGVTAPAIVKIDSAEIPGDGQTHQLTVRVWQAVGNRTSASSRIRQIAQMPVLRPASQPEWCGATPIRQGETLRSGPYNTVIGHVSDLTRIDWRHSGAVQIMARLPKAGAVTLATIIVGYADHDETTFYVENLGLAMGWSGGVLHPVLFGVAAIQHGTFGPVCWAATPVSIRDIDQTPQKAETNPDVIAGTARILRLDWLKDEIGKAIFLQNGWIYPDYWATGTADTRRRDIVNQALDKLLRAIKDRIRRGGSVTLDDLGRFEARWNATRTVRSVGFIASLGFMEGTKAGYVLTDAQAKGLNP